MGSSKKLKRKVIVDDKIFYWYVGKDPRDKFFAKALHIVSPSKDFLVLYRLDFVSEGSLLDKLEVIKSDFIEPSFYEFNQHRVDKEVTPKLVRDILLFCLNHKFKY